MKAIKIYKLKSNLINIMNYLQTDGPPLNNLQSLIDETKDTIVTAKDALASVSKLSESNETIQLATLISSNQEIDKAVNNFIENPSFGTADILLTLLYKYA